MKLLYLSFYIIILNSLKSLLKAKSNNSLLHYYPLNLSKTIIIYINIKTLIKNTEINELVPNITNPIHLICSL